MASIYTNRNDNTGSHTTVNPNLGTTWAGGVVPLTTDDAYIVGRRTTINMASFLKWTGPKTITVASTTNFAPSGFFYTVTDQSQIVKINYTSITSTTFVGCTVDETDPQYTWTDSGWASYISNGAYVHNPAYIVTINEGETFECNILYIQEGGWLNINGGTLKVNTAIYVRDGRLIGRGVGQIIISRFSNALANANVGFLTAENYQLSIIDIDGGETRTMAYLGATAELGSGVLSITGLTNGNFSVGDEIAVYQEGDVRRRNNGYVGYRDATCSFKDMDEGFDVVGVSGNNIYIGLRNGAVGSIKAVTIDGPQKVLDVKPTDVYFNKGDKVVINNAIYTIDSVEDSEFTMYDYDFTDPGTDLSDFWVNDPTHVYSGGWTIYNGIGIGTNTTGYRELVHKYLWEREVIVEAWMSPLDGYSSGTRGTGRYGILTSYDPAFRWGHRGDDSFKSDYFQVHDAGDAITFLLRSASNYPNNRLSRNTQLRNELRTAALFRVDTRKARTQTSINGVEFSTDYRRDGNYKGLVGLVNSNDRMRCSRLTIKIPTQKIRITTANNITTSSIVYRTGSEILHPIGRKVVKLASVNTGNGSHQDLAFAYNGQNGNGRWPQVIQLNGATATNGSFPYLHNHDMNIDYYYDLGNATTARSITIDLITQQTFTHVSFVPRIQDYSTYYGMNGVAIYGSNDLTNWTTLYGPTNDTKKWYYLAYGKMGYYPTGTVSFRYVKFETKGAQQGTYATNRYVNIGVHDFSEGYTIDLNNASDYNIGDKITVTNDSGYSIGSREYEAYYAWVSNNASDPETFWHGGWLMECTITNKIGNKIYLDRPVFWGYIENADSVHVVKTNRNFLITGTMGPSNSTNDWRWPNITFADGSLTGRNYSFRNARLQYIGSGRYVSSTSFNRGITSYHDNYWNHLEFDGTVHMMGPDVNTLTGVGSQYSLMIIRNSLIMGMYSGYWHYYPTSYTGSALFNNKIFSNIYGIYGTLATSAFSANYNEVLYCDYGITLNSLRADRGVKPHFMEIKRNSIKATSNSAFSFADETVGPMRIAKIKFENNKARGMDDYIINSRMFDGMSSVDMNAMADHTGSRLSRYRNEGYVISGDFSSALVYANPLINFGRYGYDLAFGAYPIIERDYSRPQILRAYTVQGDAFFPIIGMELDVNADAPVQIRVKFDYRFPMIARIQDDGTDDGRLRCYSLQNGTVKELKYGLVPSTMTDSWHTFDETFTLFDPIESRIIIYLNKVGQNGYVEFRNSISEVLCDYPDKIRVIGNSFKLNRLWDQYGETRDIRPLTGLRSTKINKIKF